MVTLKNLLSGAITLLLAVSLQAQKATPGAAGKSTSAVITFEKIYSDSLNQMGRYVIETPEGYLVAGFTLAPFGPAPSNDALLLHVDHSGNVIWQKRYGLGKDEEFNVVIPANESNGYVAVGFTTSFGGDKQVFIVRTDPGGNVIWSKTFGENFDEEGLNIIKVPAEVNVPEGYVVSGTTERLSPAGGPGVLQPYVIRLDDLGNPIWMRAYPDPNQVIGGEFQVNYYENNTLFTSGTTDTDGAFFTIDASTGNNAPVAHLFNGNFTESLFYMQPTFDGNLILADQTTSMDGGALRRQWVCKVAKAGGPLMWSKTYMDGLGHHLRGRVETVSDGGYLLTPYDPFEGITNEPILIKIDPVGNVLWSYKYGGPDADRFFRAQETSDGGFIAVGHTRTGTRNDVLLVKTDKEGRLDSCCRQKFDVRVEVFQPENRQQIREQLFLPEPVPTSIPFPPTGLTPEDYCPNPNPMVNITIPLCPGETVTIGGGTYTAPNTVTIVLPGSNGDCDTLAKYDLILRPQVHQDINISLCPGETFNIGGTDYVAPNTVTITLPGSGNECDTLRTYHLFLLPQPTKTETFEFCPGTSITVHGVTYTMPGTYAVVLPAATGCDTLLTLILAHAPVHEITLNCPAADIHVVAAEGATSAVVTYSAPTATSTCPGSIPAITLLSGLPSGSSFPLGTTKVCYVAKDPANCCSKPDTCCFNVVVTEPPCDDQQSGCLYFEQFKVVKDATGIQTYSFQVTNNCPNALMYVAFQLPDGVVAVSPPDGSVYTAPSGRKYSVRNPNFSPFYSIRFKPVTNDFTTGVSDVFEFKLPQQVCQNCVHVIARVYPKVYYEGYLCCPMSSMSPTPDNEVEAGMVLEAVDLEPKGQFSVFPNPTTGALTVDLSAWKGIALQLRVLDQLGRPVHRSDVLGGEELFELDLPASLAAGMYFLEVLPVQGERQVLKFVLNR